MAAPRMGTVSSPITDDHVDAYLARLGLDRATPSIHSLRQLHRAHVEKVPYETVWLHLDERRTIDPIESVEQIAWHGRGGYCFHLNGAFSELLAALGFHVGRKVGGVHGPDGPNPESMTNHLALTVDDLPSDHNPGGRWLVDVGTGDALHDPIPLRAGVYQQGPLRFELHATDDGIGDWHLLHDPKGWYTGVNIRDTPATMDDFVGSHQRFTTSPASSFLQSIMLVRRDAQGVDMLRGLVMRRIDDDDRPPRILERRDEWFDVLADTFNIRLGTVSRHGLDQLWNRVSAAHKQWERQGTQTP